MLSYTDSIDDLVCSLEMCEYKTGLFKDVLEKVQKLVDDLNLRSYSNLVAWVGHLDGKVCVDVYYYNLVLSHISAYLVAIFVSP